MIRKILSFWNLFGTADKKNGRTKYYCAIGRGDFSLPLPDGAIDARLGEIPPKMGVFYSYEGIIGGRIFLGGCLEGKNWVWREFGDFIMYQMIW